MCIPRSNPFECLGRGLEIRILKRSVGDSESMTSPRDTVLAGIRKVSFRIINLPKLSRDKDV